MPQRTDHRCHLLTRRVWGGASLAAVSLLLALALSSRAKALINLNYTPVQLVRQSQTILRIEIGPLGEKGACPVKVVKALKGQVPDKFQLRSDQVEEIFIRDFSQALDPKQPSPAWVFLGDFLGAKMEGGDDVAAAPAGSMHVGGLWFAICKQDDGSLLITKDPLNVKAVWAGGGEMLERLVEYVQADPRADVPVVESASWGRDLQVTALAGAASACQAVELIPGGKPCLFIACESGDRVFQLSADGAAFQDLTEKFKLTTKSKCAAWADFNGDGRLDLASWDGKTVALYPQTEAGALGPKTAECPLANGCLRLTPLDAGQPGKAGLLVSTTGAPELLTFAAAGKLASQKLPAPPPAAGGKPVVCGPCVVADFDGDGLLDVVQVRSAGALFYRGKAPGAFEAPTEACKFRLGEQLTDAAAGDFDGDGMLDVVVANESGCCLLTNQGGGKFAETLHEAGEVSYNANKPEIFASAVLPGDLNNDGRQDLAVLFKTMNAQFYFNRGFRCFGIAMHGLDLDKTGMKSALAVKGGALAGVIADFNGDGAQDVAFVTVEGQVWTVFREATKGPLLGVTVSAPAQVTGPVRVVAYEGARCLGAQLVSTGGAVLFGKTQPGPLTLKWRIPGRPEQGRTVVTLRPTRFELAPEK